MQDTTPPTSGGVTFLFTDVEGSTRLWNQDPDTMRGDLALHDALLRAAIERNHGHVFKTIGDAFCAAFGAPQEALTAAVEAQRSLYEQLPSVRVRMAVHTGDAEAREGGAAAPAGP
jgi:class 3 adenylate cyclase